MSMILDALRRADAERERGTVPGLHAQPVASVSLDAASQPRPSRWHWIAIGALVVLVAVLVWMIIGRATPPPPAVAAAGSADVALAAPAAVAAPAVAQPATDAQRTLPIAEAAPWPQSDPRSVAAKASAAARHDVVGSAAGGAAAESAIYGRDQLPESIRAALPALTLGGSMYSSNRANRTLIVNGGLYRENDQVAADLRLEEIGQKAAIFRFRGYRFEVPY